MAGRWDIPAAPKPRKKPRSPRLPGKKTATNKSIAKRKIALAAISW